MAFVLSEERVVGRGVPPSCPGFSRWHWQRLALKGRRISHVVACLMFVFV